MITRHRPEQLDRWLHAVRAVVAQTTAVHGPIAIVVVDSSVDGCSTEVVRRHQRMPGASIDYVRGDGPGYSRARNLLVHRCRERRADWLAMADDDDLPEPSWLQALLETAEASGAEAVCGPRLMRDASVPDWWARLRSDDAGLVSGAEPPALWTCNLLVSIAMLGRVAPGKEVFSMRFDRGGEDAELAMRLRAAGVRRAWAPDAVVTTDNDEQTARIRPLLRRRYVGGQIFAYSERDVFGLRPMRVVTSLVRLGQGAVRASIGWAGRDRARVASGAIVVAGAIGNLRGLTRRTPPTWVSFAEGP